MPIRLSDIQETAIRGTRLSDIPDIAFPSIPSFDPEGIGYDYETAIGSGGKPDAVSGHWGSLDPRTGMVLKGRKHATWDLMEEEEKRRGSRIVKRDGRYYSVSKPRISFSRVGVPLTGVADKSGLIEKAGIPEIFQGIREMVAPTTPYTQEESDRMAGEIPKRLKLALTYYASLGGRLGPKGLREDLLRQANELAGFGPALMPVAGETGIFAIEWGIIYPKLFAAAGWSQEAIGKIPRVARATEAIKKMGGLTKLAEKFPRRYTQATNIIKAIEKGAGVGGVLAGAETLGKDMEPGEILSHVSKRAALVAGVAGTFQAASEVDTAIYTSRLRKALIKSSNLRFANYLNEVDKMPIGASKSAAYKSLESLKQTELRGIDRIVSQAEAQLLGLKKGKLYQLGQEQVESPQKAAERLIKYGLEPTRPAPKGVEALEKGLGKTEPFIKMPMTKVAEVVESSRTALATARHPLRAAQQVVKGQPIIPKAPPTGVTPPPITPVRLEDVPVMRAEPTGVEALTDKELREKILSARPTSPEWVAAFKEMKRRKIEAARPPAAAPVAEAKPEAVEVAPEAEPTFKAEEPVEPKLYIGNVTRRMRTVFAEIFEAEPEEVRVFTEEGFPTKRTGITVTRTEAQEALIYLTEDLDRQFRENKIRTENDLALANAHWGDIVQLREVLGLPKIARPFKVIRSKGHLVKVFPKIKERIEKAVQPSKMFEAGMTVQQVLQTAMKKAEVASAKAWLEGAKDTVAAHKDLARYAAEKLKGVDITQAERTRLLKFVSTGRTPMQKAHAVAAIEMLAEQADRKMAFAELKTEVKKIKPRIGKTMQEKGIRPEYARKLNTLLDSFTTKKLSLWRMKDIGSLKNYLDNLKEGISNDPSVDEAYRVKLAELMIPERRLKQLERLSKSDIHLLKAADIRTITAEIKRLVTLNEVKQRIYLGRKARHASEYLKRAVKEQEEVLDNSKIIKEQTALTTKQKGGVLREMWRYVAGIHNHDVKTLVWSIEGGRTGALYDILVEGSREGRRVEAEHRKKIISYIEKFLSDNKITPSDLAKLSSGFQRAFRGPKQRVRKFLGAVIPTYEIGGTNWTMAELMSMYMHTRNDFSLKAMTKEGIASIFEEKKALTAEDLAKVTNLVENNRVAKALTDMYAHIAENINKPAINEVSTDLKGIEIADIYNYFTVERRSLGTIAGNQEYRISLLESQGFLQDRTGSKNPIIIRDFFAVLKANIDGVAEYVGMAKPFRAAHTVLSYKPLLKAIDAKGREVWRRHVNTLIERTESKIRPRGKVEAVFGRVLRAVPRAVLASPGIMAGQITSEFSYAATDIPKKYLIGSPVPSEKQVERVGKKFSWAWSRKHLGATSIETRNISSTDALLRMFTGNKAIINLPTQGINWVDMKAITFGWLACEEWVKDTTKLEGDALYEEINKRAHKAISESQPMFETENRSILTSSENVIARSFVMFRSYIDQTLRIMSRAQQGRINRTISQTRYLGMIAAVMAGFVAWKTLRTLINAALFRRKKDPYEFAKDVALSPLRAFNFVGYQVERQVSRMLDIWMGRKPQSRYWDAELENLVVSAINEVWRSMKDFSDALAYYGTDEVYKSGPNKGKLKSDVLLVKAIENLALSIGKVYGLPTPVIKKGIWAFRKKEEKTVFKTRKPVFKKKIGR